MLLSACGGGSGGEGSELPVPYASLRSGVIFSTRAIRGSAGYDLYWIPFPDVRVTQVLPATRLTDTMSNETQPAVARSGLGMAFASDDGIHVITAPEGRFRRVSDTSGTTFRDSLPALTPRADRVAWVREDTSKPIGDTGFFETFIMMANFDGTDARALEPKTGVVQDTPVFSPSDDPAKTKIAWSEFAAESVIPGAGPSDYGIEVFDYVARTGTFACKSRDGVTPGTENLPNRGWPYRCFGQHLTWPLEDVLVLSQDMLEISLSGGPLASVWGAIVETFQQQQIGIPQIGSRADGFFPAFPISSSYTADVSKIVMDGVVGSLEGDQPTLSIIVSEIDGTGVYRVQIDGWMNDLDTTGTNAFLFSLATPRAIPFF
jgi:hypothetical protein